MKIPDSLLPTLYNISKMIYDKKYTFSEGLKIITENNEINKNSAADYINNFRYLVQGKRFTRTLNKNSMTYFFENIYKDYGQKVLNNAVHALEKHIEYYENKQNNKYKMYSMRKIYKEYSILVKSSPDEIEQQDIIRDILKNKTSKHEILNELLNQKENEQEKIVYNGKAYKRDNKTIAQIKILRDFQCQICGKSILKKDGSKYIEAAHIQPKYLEGAETLNNILILCPNHHKEFDFGNRVIKEHNNSFILFTLNNREYYIRFCEI